MTDNLFYRGTVDNVFTGIPVDIGKQTLVGPGKTEDATTVIALNAHYAEKRKDARLEPEFFSRYKWFWGILSWH